ncbi:MAG: hypothetical protein KKA73_28175 [Chloroflexi bacterium]|nr:hypothetical protein [Chloroflexota bacterium]
MLSGPPYSATQPDAYSVLVCRADVVDPESGEIVAERGQCFRDPDEIRAIAERIAVALDVDQIPETVRGQVLGRVTFRSQAAFAAVAWQEHGQWYIDLDDDKGSEASPRWDGEPMAAPHLTALLGLCAELGVGEGDLDETVHELFAARAAAVNNDGLAAAVVAQSGVVTDDPDDAVHELFADQAAAVNNGGLAAQVTLLIVDLGPGGAELAIRRAAESR